MDFSPGEELEAVRDLAEEILEDRATPERIAEVEGSHARLDERLWKELARSGLLGVALPEEEGGAGLGLAALCVVLEAQGRFVAPVPLWSSVVAALAIAVHGDVDLRRSLLPSFVDGATRTTLALEEFEAHDPDTPRCAAAGEGEEWRLTGVKAAVPTPTGADHVLVSATTDQGTGLFLVAPDAEGVHWEDADTTDRDRSGHLTLDGARARALGAPGTGVLEHTVQCATAALAALQTGVAQGALRLAADHLAGREQFGRPLATFQAVQHQLADCYIDVDSLRVCRWQAVAAIEGDGSAASRTLVARWWTAKAGADVVHRVQHLHGGVGVDVDHPVHRYFLWGKQIAATFGGESASLAALGDVLAGEDSETTEVLS